ncbi:GSU2403 family nucleotidyltransferase fold protein [Caenispirillum salinarum]|uniref:nucleotidyltransferase family protein n=1 Tax=Caenispirillum salinarum TaxID=859058 RepID=UPI00384BC157
MLPARRHGLLDLVGFSRCCLQNQNLQATEDGMREIGLSVQTMFADLVQQCADAAFESDFPENGSFSRKSRRGRDYWYYQGYGASGRYTRYVGPADDPDIAERVARFKELKGSFRERRRAVSALKAAGLPAPAAFVGDLLEGLTRAGLFRLRCVLIGTQAYQTYAGTLGLILPSAQLTTADLDIAQFHGVSVSVEDTLPPILDILHQIDPTFRPVPDQAQPMQATSFINSRRYMVEFLTPDRGSDDFTGRPAPMPALGGASARALRFLDFLIRDPIRSVLLHGSGIPVTVPAPERYAVHKLIVASRRRASGDTGKREKDLAQAGTLIQALGAHRGLDLTEAWIEAWQRGPAWQEALVRGRAGLNDGARDSLGTSVTRAAADLEVPPADVGF